LITVFDASGRMTQFITGISVPTTVTLAGTHNEFGTDGVLAWDRWTGNVNFTIGVTTTTTNFGANQGLHTVVGLPTPIASMPAGVTFTYNLLGATSPTFSTGTTAPGTFSGTLVGDFLSNKVGLSMTVTMPTASAPLVYNVATTGFAIGAPNPNSQLSITGSGFSGTITSTGVATCSGGCTTTVSGGFAGTGATHAGMVYQIVDSIAGNTVSGAAAFKR